MPLASPDAKFDELIASKVVASSILAGIGLDPAAVESAQLTIVENPQAVLSRDTSAQEVAEFTGPTNIEGVPGTWKVTRRTITRLALRWAITASSAR